MQYERGLRMAVVMYGGVSLAIYMNGATQELMLPARARCLLLWHAPLLEARVSSRVFRRHL